MNNPQMKTPLVAASGAGNTKAICERKFITGPKPKKWARILAEFAAGESLNMYEAERLGDHTLRSTVSRLQSLGIVIDRATESVPGYAGIQTTVCRYRLAEGSRARALEILRDRRQSTREPSPNAREQEGGMTT